MSEDQTPNEPNNNQDVPELSSKLLIEVEVFPVAIIQESLKLP